MVLTYLKICYQGILKFTVLQEIKILIIFKNLKILNLQDKVKVLSMNPLIKEDLRNTLSEVNPNYIINLSGVSSVGDSFKKSL